MKELRQGRTDPPNYRKIWMAEAKRGLQAAVTAEVESKRAEEELEGCEQS